MVNKMIRIGVVFPLLLTGLFISTVYAKEIKLPAAQITRNLYLNDAIQQRRSVRNFSDQPLTLEHISQLMWAAQGVTDIKKGLRTIPSAGALYPLDLYIVKKDGIWRYHASTHTLMQVDTQDAREELSKIAYDQSFVSTAPIDIVVVGTFKRSAKKYGAKGIPFTYIEAGHATQNILLEVQELGLVATAVGGFDENEMRQLFKFSLDKTPVYIIAVGFPKSHKQQ